MDLLPPVPRPIPPVLRRQWRVVQLFVLCCAGVTLGLFALEAHLFARRLSARQLVATGTRVTGKVDDLYHRDIEGMCLAFTYRSMASAM